ncbi:MAG TPA: hypothetical protein VFF06_36945 [Polyangia bacterium]|nr:hypothetical protein [Polyangia bacterium]
MAYRDELLAARSRLALDERELAGRRAEPERLRALAAALRGERRRLKRPWRSSGATTAPSPLASIDPKISLPRVEELARELAALDGPQLEIRARAVAAELAASGAAVRKLADEVERLRAECRALREHPRPTVWPYFAGGLLAAGLAYLVVYSIFVWWLARVSLLGLT